MFKHILKLFLFLQAALVVSCFLGQKFLPLQTGFLGRKFGEFAHQPLLWPRANFDGFHYLSIARNGYGYLEQMFFPFYPKLIKFLYPLFNSFLFSGLFISSLFFILCLKLLGEILKEEGENKKTVRKTLLFLVLFPASFYFLSVYTESLFLFLILSSFWLAKKKKWLLAGLTAGLASYTRLVGICLLPALVCEYYESESGRKMKERIKSARTGLIYKFRIKYLVYFFKSRWVHLKNFFFIFLSGWGLLAHSYYLKKTCGDWLYFIKIRPSFGGQRPAGRVIMPYQVFWRYLKMIFAVDPKTFVYFNVWLEFLTALLFLGLLAWGWYRRKQNKIKTSWLVFSSLVYLLPTLTGTFSSMPRYVLACFPCFLVLAKLKLPKVIYFFSGALLLLCTALFARGYWIA